MTVPLSRARLVALSATAGLLVLFVWRLPHHLLLYAGFGAIVVIIDFLIQRKRSSVAERYCIRMPAAKIARFCRAHGDEQLAEEVERVSRALKSRKIPFLLGLPDADLVQADPSAFLDIVRRELRNLSI